MTRRLQALDRAAVLLTGLILLAAGLALLNWRFDWIGSWPGTLTTQRFTDVEADAWWPWASAGGGLVIGLVALAWVLAHAPRRGERAIRLTDASDQHGAIRVDLSTVAKAVAADFEARTAVTRVKGTAHQHGGIHVIELRGHLDPHATGDSIESAAARCAQNFLGSLS